MANQKYEFTGETKNFFGITLERIRALASFGVVARGELGGWIKDEASLSITGDAWVSGDAQVYGDAQVSGKTDFFLAGPLGSRRSFLTIHADLKLGIRFTTGCFSGSEYQFKEAIQKTHGDSDYAKQYRAAIDLALMVVKPAAEEAKVAA